MFSCSFFVNHTLSLSCAGQGNFMWSRASPPVIQPASQPASHYPVWLANGLASLVGLPSTGGRGPAIHGRQQTRHLWPRANAARPTCDPTVPGRPKACHPWSAENLPSMSSQRPAIKTHVRGNDCFAQAACTRTNDCYACKGEPLIRKDIDIDGKGGGFDDARVQKSRVQLQLRPIPIRRKA